MDQTTDTLADTAEPAKGRIDIHSHLLPSVDDGCMAFEESLECVRRLKKAGFVGSICTPHVIGSKSTESNNNQIQHIRCWVSQFRQELCDAQIEYQLWPGGELRLFDGVIDWLKYQEVPTLADSRCVLVDFWEPVWPAWIMKAFEWLLANGFQPILAHPERLAGGNGLDGQLKTLTSMGVWLQGNFRPMTGLDGYEPDIWVRRLLSEDRYQFMAMDTHRPNTLDDRLDGMRLVEQEYGLAMLNRLTIEAPRRLVFGSACIP